MTVGWNTYKRAAWWAEEDRVAELTRRWLRGESALNIGKAMGISRHAAKAKARRLGLPARSSPIRRTNPALSANRAANQNQPPRVWPYEQVRQGQCLYPFGDPKRPDFRFCGVRAIEESSYCLDHHYVVYMEGSEVRRVG